MASEKRFWVAGIVFILLVCASAYSAWTEPIDLEELSGPRAGKIAITGNELLLFYNKPVPEGSTKHYLIEARRQSKDDLFEQQRVLYELDSKGNYINSPWISSDGLRLYYAHAEWSDTHRAWHRFLRIATRENVDSQFRVGRRLMEIHNGRIMRSPSLTSDELTILWQVNENDENKVFTASRDSKNAQFENICELTELSELGAFSVYMSPDGLTVYFSIINNEELHEIWKGKRQSLEDNFGKFEPLNSFINKPGISNGSPVISPDRSSLYFYRYDQHRNIYVSEWVETPVECAIRNVREAIAEKEKAIEAVNSGIEKEVAALTALFKTIKFEDFEGLNRPDVFKSIRKILQAVQKQVSARRSLRRSIGDLESSLAVLLDENSSDNYHQHPNNRNRKNNRNLRREAGQKMNQRAKSVRVNESGRTKK